LPELIVTDGSVAQFLVTSLVVAQKDQFPTEQVYGLTEQPTLRLITCGGSFDQGAGFYLGNVIVYAQHVGNREAPLRLAQSFAVRCVATRAVGELGPGRSVCDSASRAVVHYRGLDPQ